MIVTNKEEGVIQEIAKEDDMDYEVVKLKFLPVHLKNFFFSFYTPQLFGVVPVASH